MVRCESDFSTMGGIGMKKPADGMQMFHEQVNDRVKWHESMEKRTSIISELRRIGRKDKKGNRFESMPLKELKVMLNRARQSQKAKESRNRIEEYSN